MPLYTEILNYHKDGESYWVSLAINPVRGKDGKVERFVSIQSNVSATKQKALEASMQIEAIGRSQAVIEFTADGTAVSANDNFLRLFGYSLDEIKGKNHNILVDDNYRHSGEYREFWNKLERGDYPANLSASPKAGVKSGYKHRITRLSI